MENLINQFVNLINEDENLHGDVLEFGTGHGHSAEQIVKNLKNKKIFTFDGFRGLPKTNKVIPQGTNWFEGALMSDYENTKKYLEKYENIVVTKCMTWELESPEEYGIKNISAVNIDLDLYEGTLDALRYINKCNWDYLLIRFDDWGYYRNTSQIKEEVDEHERAAFFDFISETNYNYSFYDEINKLVDDRQIIVKIWK
jgi:hypothetical protein